MSFSREQLEKLTHQAIDAARTAGELIAEHRNQAITIGQKALGTSQASQIITDVDHKAQAVILEQLLPSLKDYDLALLSEEAPDDGRRHNKPAFWCIDPMDGTLAFANNKPGFSVSISLVARNGSPLIGVVYDPVEKTTYHALHNQGAFKNNHPITPPQLDMNRPLTLRTDYSFQSDTRLQQTQSGLETIADRIGVEGAEIEFHIGAVSNACSVLEEPNTCYFKYPRPDASGGSLWDYAATACICQEAGAVASDIFGNPMDLNRVDSTFMNHRGLLFAGHKMLAKEIIALNERLNHDYNKSSQE
ncbi:MAG: inositol monophosphatase family protein [Candidatus Thiodiazotropha sp. 6PLUC2]